MFVKLPYKLRTSHVCLYSLLSAYSTAISYLALFHEPWRDEVRAWSIARQWNTPLEIFSLLNNEGHPFLWYLVIKVCAWCVGVKASLIIASLLVSILAAFVFLRFAPFPTAVKALWLAGYYPLYEYSVVCRNYGLGMLLFFVACSLLQNNRQQPLVFAAVLALLAQSSFYGILLAICMCLAWITNLALESRRACSSRKKINGSPNSRTGTILGLTLVCAGIVAAIYQVVPDDNSVVVSTPSLSLSSLLPAFASSLTDHGQVFHNAFWMPVPLLIPLLFVLVYLFVLRSFTASVFLFSFLMAMEMSHRLVFEALALRHQGFLLLGLVGAVWIDRQVPHEALGRCRFKNRLVQYSSGLGTSLLSILCCLQILHCYKTVSDDLHRSYTSMADFANFIEDHPELQQLTVTAEPDYLSDTCAYYLSNPVYLARQDTYGKYVSFTKEALLNLTLDHLLDEVSSVVNTPQTQSLLLLPANIGDKGQIDMFYGKSFSWNQKSLDRLHHLGTSLGIYEGSITGEDFEVFLLNQITPETATLSTH